MEKELSSKKRKIAGLEGLPSASARKHRRVGEEKERQAGDGNGREKSLGPESTGGDTIDLTMGNGIDANLTSGEVINLTTVGNVINLAISKVTGLTGGDVIDPTRDS